MLDTLIDRQVLFVILFLLTLSCLIPVEGRRRRLRPRQFDQSEEAGYGPEFVVPGFPSLPAGPPPPAGYGVSSSYQDQDTEGYGTYRFGYKVDDSYSGNHQSRTEERDPSGRVTGSYSVMEPDGNVRTVYYIADKYGYRAFVKNSRKPSSSFGLPPPY